MSIHLIPADDAATMTSDFRAEKENLLTTGMRNMGTLPICETFDRDAFDIILSDTNCTGVRIYFALDGNSKVILVITGVNSSDEDIFIPTTHPANNSEKDCVVEAGLRCPSNCPPSSSLNS